MGLLRILLVDAQTLFRKGIAHLLSAAAAEFEVVGEARDADEALDRARIANPDVILLSVPAEGAGGLDLVPRIRSEFPLARIVLLNVTKEKPDFLAALRTGSVGYLPEQAGPEDLFAMLRESIPTGTDFSEPSAF